MPEMIVTVKAKCKDEWKAQINAVQGPIDGQFGQRKNGWFGEGKLR